jgi:hypothetical protein
MGQSIVSGNLKEDNGKEVLWRGFLEGGKSTNSPTRRWSTSSLLVERFSSAPLGRVKNLSKPLRRHSSQSSLLLSSRSARKKLVGIQGSNCAGALPTKNLPDTPKVPKDIFDAVIRALLNTPRMSMADLPRKRRPRAEARATRRRSGRSACNTACIASATRKRDRRR